MGARPCMFHLLLACYLRSLAATQVEKSTIDVNRYGLQPRWMNNQSASSELQVQRGQTCDLDGDCEACQ